MPPVPHSIRPLLVAAALLAPTVLTGCATAEAVSCDDPGEEVAQALIVADTKPVRGEIVLVKCTADRTITIVDQNDRQYGSLAEFQEENELFAPDDRIYIPKNFPSLDDADDRAFGTQSVPARVSTTWQWWLLGGGIAVVAVAAVAGFAVWRRRGRHIRQARDFSASLQESLEPEPKPDPAGD